MITHSAVENCEQYDGMKFWLDPHERSVSNSNTHEHYKKQNGQYLIYGDHHLCMLKCLKRETESIL